MSGLINYFKKVLARRASSQLQTMQRAERFEQHTVVSHYLEGVMDRYDPEVPLFWGHTAVNGPRLSLDDWRAGGRRLRQLRPPLPLSGMQTSHFRTVIQLYHHIGR